MNAVDPFADPAPIASEFASADSFRGRLVMFEVTKLELDVPNDLNKGQVQDRATVTVTVLDGSEQTSPVQVYSQKVPTGKFLTGAVHKGVWFSQERVVKALCPDRVMIPGRKVLGVLDTYKPGQVQGPGNPWGITAATAEQKQAAITRLQVVQIQGADTPTAQPAPAAPQAAQPAGSNPFG